MTFIRFSAMLAFVGTLTGCALMTQINGGDNSDCIDHNGNNRCGTIETNQPQETAQRIPNYNNDGLKTRYSNKLLSHYVEQMAMQMVGTKPPELTTPVAVASFVQFDSTLARTDVLGNQLAESFIHELQAFGLPVVDYKVTGAIRITPRGDFAFSREVAELERDQAIGYILSGTIIHAQDGVVVNARIVGLSSKRVVASAESFIPGFVLNKLYPNSAPMVQ